MSLRSGMLLCSIAALAPLMSVPAARADAADATQHRTEVRFGDLDLNRLSDATVLYDRIEVAARQVCGPRTLTGSYATAPGFAHCYANAVAQAVARVDSPTLTTVYRAQLTRSELQELSLAER